MVKVGRPARSRRASSGRAARAPTALASSSTSSAKPWRTPAAYIRALSAASRLSDEPSTSITRSRSPGAGTASTRSSSSNGTLPLAVRYERSSPWIGSSDQKRPQRPTRKGRGAAGVGAFFGDLVIASHGPPRHRAAMKASARSSVSSFFVLGSSGALTSGTMPFLSMFVPSGVK